MFSINGHVYSDSSRCNLAGMPDVAQVLVTVVSCVSSNLDIHLTIVGCKDT